MPPKSIARTIQAAKMKREKSRKSQTEKTKQTPASPPPPPPPPPQPSPPPPPPAPKPRTLLELPVDDLLKPKGGAWNLDGRVNWKKSGIETRDGRPVLRVFYGKGSGTSSDPGIGGVLFKAVPKGLPSERAMMSFDVFFAPGWNFSKGGKFGGFMVGHGDASGYRHSDTASSHRIMWKVDGGAIAYIYPPSNLDQEDERLRACGCGIAYFHDLFPAGTLKVGAWNSVQIGLKLNTFRGGKPQPDGVAVLTVNGITGTVDNIRWRRSPDLKISSIAFNTFFGGPDPAVVDCTAFFRDFKLIDF